MLNITFEQLYNSANGIVGIWDFDTIEEFTIELSEIQNNADFTFFGLYESLQDINDELEYQGLSLDQITKMSLNRYGDCIEVLQDPSCGIYWVFVGAR